MFAPYNSGAGYHPGRRLANVLKTIAANLSLLEPAVRTSAAANYVPVIGDRVIRRTNAAAQTLTIPTNATAAFDVGHEIKVEQAGAGALSIVAAGGVTFTKLATKTLVCAGQGGVVRLIKVDTNVWSLSGDLALV